MGGEAAPIQPAPTQPAAPKPERKPKAAKPAGSGSNATTVGIALQSVLHRFKQTADNPATVANIMPPEAKFMRPVSPGVIIDGLYDISDSPLSALAEFRIYNDVIAVGDYLHGYNNWSAQAGARYALSVAPDLSPFISATIQRTQTSVFRFVETEDGTSDDSGDSDDDEADTEDSTSENGINQFAPAVESLYGLRVGGGIQMELPSDLLLIAELSELFGPYPIATHLGATVYKEIGVDWNLRGGLDMDFKHVAMSIDGVPLKVRDTEIAFSVGVDYIGL